MGSKYGVVFEDFFPEMVDKLGAERFLDEVCSGFLQLLDGERGVITKESLTERSAAMGLKIGDVAATWMIREGDLDGDGCLSQFEFCVLMFRLSPGLMNMAWKLLEEALFNY